MCSEILYLAVYPSGDSGLVILYFVRLDQKLLKQLILYCL